MQGRSLWRKWGGKPEEKGRGYGREDFEVAHDLERCIVKWSGILKSISIGKFSIIIKQMCR